VRILLALAVVLVACSGPERGDDASASDSPSVMSAGGADRLLVRFPRTGGTVRVFAYPDVDSLVWTSRAQVPALDRVLGFDSDAGSVVALDTKGVPLRLDLRLGDIARETKAKLSYAASQDGNAIYGVAPDGTIRRLTPAGEWRFKPPSSPRELFPQSDGGLLVVSDARNGTTVWRMHPPQESLVDTARLPLAQRAVGTPLGDRLYFTVDTGLIGVRARDLTPVPSVRIRERIRAAVTTPSGDRIYLLTAGSPDLVVVDRYAEEIAARITLPDTARELRMDPTGRYILARAAKKDSVWVVAVGTDKLVARVETGWRADLPLVTPDGALALLRGTDVALVDGESFETVRRVPGGGRDLWYFIEWNGFRPRNALLDEPVQFEGMDSVLPDSGDTLDPFDATPSPDSIAPTPDTVVSPPRLDTAPATPGFTVQFAALRSEQAANAVASQIEADGQRAHVVHTTQGGLDIWRVVLGPYPTRERAEQVARSAGRSYWIYEGRP
jgi:hypothetical protein